jgi:hypothetical protein
MSAPPAPRHRSERRAAAAPRDRLEGSAPLLRRDRVLETLRGHRKEARDEPRPRSPSCHGRRDSDRSGRDRHPHEPRHVQSECRSRHDRSEVQLRVRTESQAVGRVRLRKHVVTEYEQVTVPVRREEIRLEQEPIGGPGTGAVTEVDSVAGGAVGAAVPGQPAPERSTRSCRAPSARSCGPPGRADRDGARGTAPGGHADGDRAVAGRRSGSQGTDRTRYRHRHRRTRSPLTVASRRSVVSRAPVCPQGVRSAWVRGPGRRSIPRHGLLPRQRRGCPRAAPWGAVATGAIPARRR